MLNLVVHKVTSWLYKVNTGH